MTSIAQISENEQREMEGTLKKFFTDYNIASLLKVCCAEKQKGHSEQKHERNMGIDTDKSHLSVTEIPTISVRR